MTTAATLARLDAIDPSARRPANGGFSWTFLSVELKRLFRNSTVIVFTLIFPIVMLVLIGIPNKDQAITDVPVAQGGLSAAVPIMISMAVYGAMMASTMTGVSVAAERTQGWSRQLRLTPLNPVVYILVKVLCGLVLGGIAVVVTLIIGTSLGITAPLGNLLLAGVLAWLSSLMMTSLGLAVGYAFPAQNAMRYLGPILPILSFMGGLFYPLYLMPEGLQIAAKFTPVWGIADLSQSAIIGVAPDPWAIPNLLIWFVLFTGFAVMMFRRDTKRV
ncbi:ABC transporter permease [Microbacterium sp. KUDC0406]|uniref:ABC transporter permease n=1 Tax=Microbacterium sp. KUDC0406 TaxID=2909588 RepID=UPI001F3037E4|nr:ABC transporter permease [Microbacterium sp. KUDC0406]UJP10405.1 ABC transporter permease [Microbacterium sp. KUDC0406]